MLSDEQHLAFETWLTQGGGWIGIHSAGDNSHADWRWYVENLIGGNFIGHILGPQTQKARVVVEDREHPVTRDLPAEFEHEEEWYSWDQSARALGFHVLLTVDESSYDPTDPYHGLGYRHPDGGPPDRVVALRRGEAAPSTPRWDIGAAPTRILPTRNCSENALAWAGDPASCPPTTATPDAAGN